MRISDRLNVTESSIYGIVCRVNAGLKTLAPAIIKWPTGQNLKRIKEEFQNMKGLPGIGAIDGTHIKIKGPNFCPKNYINRKGFHSILMQAICDSNYKFTNCLLTGQVVCMMHVFIQTLTLVCKLKTTQWNIFRVKLS